MRRLWLLVVFYCIVHGASGDFAVSYDGLDQGTVTSSVQQTYGAPFDFVDKTTYDAFVAAHLPKRLQPAFAPVNTSQQK